MAVKGRWGQSASGSSKDFFGPASVPAGDGVANERAIGGSSGHWLGVRFCFPALYPAPPQKG